MVSLSSILLWFNGLKLHFTLEWCIEAKICYSLTHFIMKSLIETSFCCDWTSWSCILRWNDAPKLKFVVVWRFGVIFYVGMMHWSYIFLWFDMLKAYFTLQWCVYSSNVMWFDVLKLNFTLEWRVGAQFWCILTSGNCILRWNDPLEHKFDVIWRRGVAFYVGITSPSSILL